MGLYFYGWMPAERGNSTWMTIKDLNPENTVLRRKKCPSIEISWTRYFHLHLGRIIRPNFNKRHGLQWLTSAPRKPECLKKLKGSFQKKSAHQAETMSFPFTQFPRCNIQVVVSREQQCFPQRCLFLMAPPERKNGFCVKAPFWSTIYQPQKLNVEGFDSIKMMILYIPAV